jgi:chemotaxis protein CheD
MTIARGFEAKLNIGERNIEATKAKAVEVGIRFRGEDVGGAHGRTVRLSAATGKVTISNVGGATYEL